MTSVTGNNNKPTVSDFEVSRDIQSKLENNNLAIHGKLMRTSNKNSEVACTITLITKEMQDKLQKGESLSQDEKEYYFHITNTYKKKDFDPNQAQADMLAALVKVLDTLGKKDVLNPLKANLSTTIPGLAEALNSKITETKVSGLDKVKDFFSGIKTAFLEKVSSVFSKNSADLPNVDPKGQIFQTKLRDEAGNVIASDTITRVETIPKSRAILQQQKLKLQNELNKQDLPLPQKKSIEAQLERVNAWEAALENGGEGTWLDTNAAQKNTTGTSLPIPANLRTHVISVDGKPVGYVNQSGTLSDLDHRHVSLEDMQNYLAYRTVYGDPRDSATLAAKKDKAKTPEGELTPEGQRLADLLIAEEGSGNILTGETLKGKMLRIENEIRKDYYEGGLESINVDDLQQKTETRLYHLKNMYFMDLIQHAESNPDALKKLKDGDSLGMTRVSFLNTNAPPKGDDQKFIHEAVFAQDMQALYNDLAANGKVIYDPNIEQSHIGVDGKFYLKAPEGEERKELKLAPYLFNISTQNEIRNIGPQKAINDATIQRMMKDVENTQKNLEDELQNLNRQNINARIGGEDIQSVDLQSEGLKIALNKQEARGKRITELKDLIEETKSIIQNIADLGNKLGALGQDIGENRNPISVAADAALLGMRVGSFVSANCWGAKDRTPVVVADVVHRKVIETVQKSNNPPSKELQGQWGFELARDLPKVAGDNIGVNAIKVSTFNLPFLFRGDKAQKVRGAIERIGIYLKSISAFVPILRDSGGDNKFYYRNPSRVSVISQRGDSVENEGED